MKGNKWIKWMIGIGGITVFTSFLQLVNDSEENNKQNEMMLKEETASFQNETEEAKQQREQQLLSLDWNEGNWDVEYSNEVIIATPKTETSRLQPAENRTRRS
ncbi:MULTISPECIES: hypothetical protein [Anoxybacillaceae]|uniref:Uncharacterized protein n=2 Tax=Anoxybacillus flavithermus TaxID=33934 RepID=A0A178T4K2_9BACL|nr:MULTISPECIES: hypothetical protein [Bacillaceae]ASA95494.1 hypothetical protein CA592_00730 [Anoxybacillus flavithermus]ELK22403.1 hypothetical protein AF6_0907 [Anoxybacillus flavithermus TNO-09.006]MBE2905165.1 hypothetical protein [Anoxybacillus flavithermus]MBE2907206.1 hypothetical protein [Anoxybacillus flavithermus]MBE2909515.1 hypothetical protein [Anoxybacillus flavithermus]